MNNKLASFIIFLAGTAVGSAITWRYIQKKYEQIAQEEIDSVKDVFSQRQESADPRDSNEETNMGANPATEKPGIAEYVAKIHEQQYITDYSSIGDKKKEKKKLMNKPYVIAPEEFGERDDYEKIGLTYYSDQKLTDEDDELVDDVEDVVGFDSLNHFGEYEDDSVFVRNDRLKCDYEILLDQRNFSDVIKGKPHRIEPAK